MLVDNENVDDLLAIHTEIDRLTGVILTSLEKRKELRKRMGDVFTELKQQQGRLPFAEAEHTEQPGHYSNGNGNGNGRKRKHDGARA